MIKLIILPSVFLILPAWALAHVGYIVENAQGRSEVGTDFNFLLAPLKDPLDLVLILSTAIIAIMGYFLIRKTLVCQRFEQHLKNRAKSYEEFLPWIARIAVGIMLIGAGVGSNLISPVLPGFPQFSSLEIFLGFLILTGLLLFPAIMAAIGLYIFALAQNIYAFGNLEILALFIVILLLASGKPGIDDLFDLTVLKLRHPRPNFVPFIVRVGLGLAMMFLAIYEKFLNPHLSELIVSQYQLTSIIPVSPEMWILSAGIIEFLVGLALVVGFQTRFVAASAFAILTVSFFFFGETVYSHITLFAALSILFVTGGGKLSLDEYLRL